MALPQPINESEASEGLRELYADIKSSLDLPYVPMMFRYLGNYPFFLEKLWLSVKQNVEDPAFERLLTTIQDDIYRAAEQVLTGRTDIAQITNQLVPQIYKGKIAYEVEKYFAVQLRLAFLAVAIREQVKGWSIGAKLLPDVQDASGSPQEQKAESLHSELHEMVIAEAATALAMQDDIREPLMKFIVFMHEEFISIITKEAYVFSRVQSEKLLIHHVTNIPHPIFASYNGVVKSIPDKSELANVFYLLSEKFPVNQTIAALMWAVSLQVLKRS